MKPAFNAVTLTLFLSIAVVKGQVPPQLQISGSSTGTVAVQWTSEVGTNYQLLLTDRLDPFSLWLPAGDAVTAVDTNAAMVVGNAGSNAFFKVHVLNEFAGFPSCHINSLTNNQIVSGIIAVSVSAQDDSRLSAVELYLDDIPIGSVTEGSPTFTINTAVFPNGAHTIKARAQDNVGIPYLGGAANYNTVVNETFSAPVDLQFQNAVRWPDAPVFMENEVFVDVVSDIYPADWTVIVEDEGGQTVRTLSGYTADGIIQTTWDGLDNLGQLVPDEVAYKVTVVVTESGLLSSQSVFATAASKVQASATGLNVYGMPDCMAEEDLIPLKDDGYAEIYAAWNAKPDKDDYPPLPPPSPDYAHLPLPRRVSLSEILTSSSPPAGQNLDTMESSGGGSSADVKTYVWKESPWGNGQIILARQLYTSGTVGAVFNATLGTTLNQVALLISAADDELPGNRSVFNNTVFVVPTHGSYGVLSNDLANPSVRAFYYHGHSDGNAIGYSESTLNDGLRASDLKRGLGNIYRPATNDVLATYQFRKPFRFVFMDGCLTGRGGFPEAFGIPRAVPGSVYVQRNYKRRAYMGWGSTTQNSIANADFRDWTLSFWQNWLTDPDYETTLGDAVQTTFQQHPSILTRAPLNIYGTSVLTWSAPH